MPLPFKFLDAYTREDRAIFFGRDREIEEMYQKVFSSKILLVYGISGTGKTSLINCGLANKFQESDWLPVNIRRGSNIVDSLWKELGKLMINPVEEDKGKSGERDRGISEEEENRKNLQTNLPTHNSRLTTHENIIAKTERDGKRNFVKAIQSLYLDHFKPIYLIFDQFEELFIFGSREERDEFIRIIREVEESDIQCKFIFSIREEYLAGVTEFEEIIQDFLANRMRVERMTTKNAIQVIEGPCRVNGIQVEQGFPEALLHKLSPEGKDVELTYLQVFLDKLYHLLPDSKPISSDSRLTTHDSRSFSLALLQETGEVGDLLGDFLEDQVNALDDPETGITILKAFVSVQGTKRQVTEEEVNEFSKTLGKPVDYDQLKEFIQRFVNLRILRDKDENNRYELRHDSLAAKIYEKITLIEKELLEVRQFLENAFHTYEQRRILLSDKDLRYLQVYEDRLFLEGRLEEFVEACKKAIHARRRQFNNILRISLAGFVLLVAGLGYYYYQTTSEKKNIERATKSLLQAKIAPELSYRTGVEAYRMDSTSSVAHFAILNAFYEMLDKGLYYDSVNGTYYNPSKLLFDFKPCEADIVSASFSRDGKQIFGWLENNSLKVWDSYGKEILCTGKSETGVLAVAMSMNNAFLAAVNEDSTGTVWTIKGEKVFSFPLVINPVNNKKAVAFSPDTRLLAASGSGNNVIIYKLNGLEYQQLEGHKSRINYLSFSPDSRFLASASDDSTVIIWNLNRKTSLFGPYGTVLLHAATARSCNFSKNSKYVLTASDDSAFAIWNLKGEQVYNYKLMGNYRNKIMDKICDAEFLGNEKLVKITVYHPVEENTFLNNDSLFSYDFKYTQRLMIVNEYYIEYLNNFLNKFVREDFNFGLLKWEGYGFYIREVGDVDYNADDHTIACEISGLNRTALMSGDILPLRYFQGTRPAFSPDRNYLLCVNKNELCLYPVTVPEIIRLIDEKRLFGELITNRGFWINIF